MLKNDICRYLKNIFFLHCKHNPKTAHSQKKQNMKQIIIKKCDFFFTIECSIGKSAEYALTKKKKRFYKD